jgi:putative glutamine amidotransferase
VKAIYCFHPVFYSFSGEENMQASNRPIIGCTTYHKVAAQANPIDIYGLMPSYIEAVKAAGGIPLLIPLGLSDEDLQTVFERIDGVLLPGGGDIEPEYYNGRAHIKMWGIDGERDRTEFFMVRTAVEQQKPILAICRGIQVLNVALGGTLWEDIPTLVPHAIVHDNLPGQPRSHLSHTVDIQPGSLLARQLNQTTTWVNSLHHQAVRDLAPGLVATACSPDGLIEAAEAPNHPYALGVQWHPENLIHDDPNMLSLFKGLVEAAV